MAEGPPVPPPGWITTRIVEQRCPICEGRKIVPAGFYAVPVGQPFSTTSTGPEKCQHCFGHGVIRTTETTTIGGTHHAR